MRVLKQSTAATVMVGPFLDKTDGVTEETGLAGAGTELSKAGAAFGAGPTLGTHDSDGWYPISLTTTHTNTLGDLTLKVHDNATHLPVWMHFTVIPANAFDAMVSGSGVGMRSDVQGWLGSAPAAVTTAGVPEVDITHIDGSAVSTSAAQLGVNVVNAAGTAWGSGAITAAALAADASAEIADAVWDEDATGHQTGGTFGQAIGDPGADANTIFGAVVTGAAGATIAADIVSIQADTDDIQSKIGAPSNLGGGATLAANLSDIESQTDDIGAAGAGLTAIPWNAAWDAEVQSEAEDALVVHRLDELLNADSDIDGAAPPTVGSVFHELLTKTAGSFTYDQATDSLEAIRDRGDAAWITAVGFSTHSAADVWASATRLLTAGTNIVLAKGTGITGFNDIAATDIVSSGAITTSGGIASADVKKVNGITVAGSGTAGDPWGP